MRMEYQLPPPQALQIGHPPNSLQQVQQQQQQQHQHLQLLQNVQQHHHQQQQQSAQQQQMLGSMQPPPTLPPLSSLPLEVVQNLPHLISSGNIGTIGVIGNIGNIGPGAGPGGGPAGAGPGGGGANNALTANVNNLSNHIANNPNNNSAPNGNPNATNNANVAALRNSMQNVANSQLQQTINTLGNNLGNLPPSSQLLHHHLQHLANVNNAAAAAVAVAANNLNAGSVNNTNAGNISNNNNNPATPNNNLIATHANNIVVNGLIGTLQTNNSNNNAISNNNNNTTNNNNANNNSHNIQHPNGNNNNNANNNNVDDNNRWTQFQVQQLWKQHASYLNGKSTSNSKEVICGDDKYKEEGDLWNVEAQTAFLGPNLWDKTLPYDADLKVTQYADLDEFLSENNIQDGLPGTHLGHSSGLGHRSDSLGHAAGLSLGLGHITTKRERSPSPSDCISPDTLNPPSPAESTFSFASSGRDFDPRTRAFSDEELKPQPMIKKSRKQFVPDELKDDKYWARRRKNNIAAKRSRDARRQKENQIAMRARYLEKENATLHQEVEQLKQENMDLRARLSKFQDV